MYVKNPAALAKHTEQLGLDKNESKLRLLAKFRPNLFMIVTSQSTLNIRTPFILLSQGGVTKKTFLR